MGEDCVEAVGVAAFVNELGSQFPTTAYFGSPATASDTLPPCLRMEFTNNCVLEGDLTSADTSHADSTRVEPGRYSLLSKRLHCHWRKHTNKQSLNLFRKVILTHNISVGVIVIDYG